MADRQRATIIDIARLAGVSVSTVSRVINGKPDVAQRTRDHILGVMQEYGFAANPVARSLVGAQTRLVGVLARTMYSAFTFGVLQGAMEVAEEVGYGLLLMPVEIESAGPSALMLRTLADGLIVVSPGLDARLDLETMEKRVVYIEQRTGTTDRGVTVTTSNREGAAELTQYLLQLGHRRIAFITGPPYLESSQQRLNGYRSALERAGIKFDGLLVFDGSFDYASGLRAGHHFASLADSPTAIMASNDREAFGVLQALRERHRRVPEDFSVVGFDDVPLAAEEEPALTTVHQPIYEMGRKAMEVMVDWIEGRDPVQQQFELPTRLVLRSSAGAPRDERLSKSD